MRNFKTLVRNIGASAALGALAVQSAHAALPTEVTTALDDAKVDGVAVAGIVLTIIIAIAAFKYVRRAL